jgi:translation initiation factor 1A|tara:strand:+ start:1237 stop:1734 length:498 start_codon:yes stop_codon:yes gene_type:complete
MQDKVPGEKKEAGQDRGLESSNPTTSGAQSKEVPKGKDTTPKPTSPGKTNTATAPRFGRKPGVQPQGEYVVRVRIPKDWKNEVLGVIEENFGSKLLVKCIDGHTRMCRIPGKIRYKLRVRLGDVVLVQKWVVQTNEKGDYLYKYKKNQVAQLLKRGFMTEQDLMV